MEQHIFQHHNASYSLITFLSGNYELNRKINYEIICNEFIKHIQIKYI